MVQQEGQIVLGTFPTPLLLSLFLKPSRSWFTYPMWKFVSGELKHIFRKIISYLNKSKREETNLFKSSLYPISLSMRLLQEKLGLRIYSILSNQLEAFRYHLAILKHCQMERWDVLIIFNPVCVYKLLISIYQVYPVESHVNQRIHSCFLQKMMMRTKMEPEICLQQRFFHIKKEKWGKHYSLYSPLFSSLLL